MERDIWENCFMLAAIFLQTPELKVKLRTSTVVTMIRRHGLRVVARACNLPRFAKDVQRYAIGIGVRLHRVLQRIAIATPQRDHDRDAVLAAK